MKLSILSIITGTFIGALHPSTCSASFYEDFYTSGNNFPQRTLNIQTLNESWSCLESGEFEQAKRKFDRVKDTFSNDLSEDLQKKIKNLNEIFGYNLNTPTPNKKTWISNEEAQNSYGVTNELLQFSLLTLSEAEEAVQKGRLEQAKRKFDRVAADLESIEPERISLLRKTLYPVETLNNSIDNTSFDIIDDAPKGLYTHNIGNDLSLMLKSVIGSTGDSLVVFDNDEVLVSYGSEGRDVGKVLINEDTAGILLKMKDYGVNLICVSSASQASVVNKLSAVGLFDLFDAVYGAEYRPEGDDYYAKHNIIQRHIDSMDTRPDNLFFVDDTDVHRDLVANTFSQNMRTEIFEFMDPVAANYASIETLQNLLGYSFEDAKTSVLQAIASGRPDALNNMINSALNSIYQ